MGRRKGDTPQKKTSKLSNIILHQFEGLHKLWDTPFFRCIMFLSYRITFFHNVFGKLIIHQKVLYDIFL